MEVLLGVQILHWKEQERQQLSLGTQTETCLHTVSGRVFAFHKRSRRLAGVSALFFVLAVFIYCLLGGQASTSGSTLRGALSLPRGVAGGP